MDNQTRVLRHTTLAGPFPKLIPSPESATKEGDAMAPSSPKVFISYSHDSPEHAKLVLRLAQRLRNDGIDARIDQFAAGRPKEGWPRWMLDQLDWAEFVLLVCTETYYRRFRGHNAPDTGKGVDWEGQLITLELYQAKNRTTKFVPVIFRSQDRAFIPEPLSDHAYCLDSEDSYQALYGFLTGQAGVPLPELGPLRKLPRQTVEPLTFDQSSENPASRSKLGVGPERPSPAPPGETAIAAPRSDDSPPSREDTRREDRQGNIAPYALIALASFLGGVGLLGLMIWKADLLVALGLTGNLYYLVLLPMGAAAAAFLFGVLQSFARYRDKPLGGMLEWGGPVAGFALVVLGGFVLVPSVATFPLTVYIHGEGGPHDLVLRNSGRVVLDLGPDRRSEGVGEQGQAYFPSIPASFRGQNILIGLESDAFELSAPKQKYRLEGNSIYVPVQRKADHLSGRVQDENGKPMPGATIRVAGLSTTTDSAGHFEFIIPGGRLHPELDLDASADGYLPKHYEVVPNANELVVQLTPAS